MNKSLIPEENFRLKRLRFRSAHRGCKETDLVLAAFAERELSLLNAAELDVYEALLDENDADIWDWLVGKSPPARPEYAPLIERMRRCGIEA